jgi:hypothetical protein
MLTTVCHSHKRSPSRVPFRPPATARARTTKAVARGAHCSHTPKHDTTHEAHMCYHTAVIAPPAPRAHYQEISYHEIICCHHTAPTARAHTAMAASGSIMRLDRELCHLGLDHDHGRMLHATLTKQSPPGHPVLFPPPQPHPPPHPPSRPPTNPRTRTHRKGHLGLDHPELGEVARRLAVLGPEGGPEGVDVPHRARVRLAGELPPRRIDRRLFRSAQCVCEFGYAREGNRGKKSMRSGQEVDPCTNSVSFMETTTASPDNRGPAT